MSFRAIILESLHELAAPATVQRAWDFPPHELWLSWVTYIPVLIGDEANPDAVASFENTEFSAITEFNDLVSRLPPEPDPMWNRHNLDAPPWPEIRDRAAELLTVLEGSSGPK